MFFSWPKAGKEARLAMGNATLSSKSTDKNPRVTVIVCAYKTGEMIRPTLDAILAQTFRNFRLVVIDDASGDDTTSVIRSYDDDRISVLVNEQNLGVTGSRNRGLSVADTPFIATCDHDDVWLPEKLQKQVDYMEQHPGCGAVGTFWTIFVSGKQRETRTSALDSSGFLKWQLFHSNCLLHSSLMMRRAVMVENGIQYRDNIPFGDDWKLSHEFSRAGEIGVISESLVKYMIHGENFSLTANERMLESGAQMMHEELSLLLAENISIQDSHDYFYCVANGQPVRELQKHNKVGDILYRVAVEKAAQAGSSKTQTQITQEAGKLWWKLSTLRAKAFGPWLLAETTRHQLFRLYPIKGTRYFLGYLKCWAVYFAKKLGLKK